MKQLLILISVVMLFGCNKKVKPVIPAVDSIIAMDTSSAMVYLRSRPAVIHDTVFINNTAKNLDSMIKPYLIMYYKSGWMDASNGIIDLNNKGKFDQNNIQKIKNSDWRRIELKVNSK